MKGFLKSYARLGQFHSWLHLISKTNFPNANFTRILLKRTAKNSCLRVSLEKLQITKELKPLSQKTAAYARAAKSQLSLTRMIDIY